MKILIATNKVNFCGVETVIRSHYERFKELGHDVHILESQGSGEGGIKFVEDGLNLTSIDIGFFQTVSSYCTEVADFVSDFDVVYVHHSAVLMMALPLISANTVVIPIIHNQLDEVVNVALFNCCMVNAVVAVSPELKQKAEEISKGIEVSLIPNGAVIPEAIPKKPIVEGCWRVLFVGRLVSDKGFWIFRLL